jgi:hypothetical protein
MPVPMAIERARGSTATMNGNEFSGGAVFVILAAVTVKRFATGQTADIRFLLERVQTVEFRILRTSLGQ